MSDVAATGSMAKVCMNAAISKFLQERIDAGDFPSAVYLVAEKGEIVFQDALGNAVAEPEKIRARSDTIYDLASLTKPLVTGLLAARQIEASEISLTTKVGEKISEFQRTWIGDVTVVDLASHISGLKAWLPLYLLADSPSPNDIAKAIERNSKQKDERAVEYSDLNFITLARMIGGKDLEQDLYRNVCAGLGLTGTWFNPLSNGVELRQIAASEKGNEYERQTCVELGYLSGSADDHKFRDQQIWGEVHDGNAWFMGGVSGHAGLFSTAEDVFKMAMQFLPNYTQLLKPETCALFTTNFTAGANEDRSFAFQLASTKDSTAGSLMSPQSFGHLGFTGTSLWIDDVTERIFILLTNRTHHHSLPFVNINAVRRRFHDLAIGELSKK